MEGQVILQVGQQQGASGYSTRANLVVFLNVNYLLSVISFKKGFSFADDKKLVRVISSEYRVEPLQEHHEKLEVVTYALSPGGYVISQ